ncbi:MAG: DUF4159 domain-containing protein [Pseudomonadota bacterium]
MSIGALTFLSPWLLAGLVALPIIYWLLRTVPPRPRQIAFPATRILAELDNVERTPDKTPWWLMLIRLIAAALVILALAQPILNPDRSLSIGGSGPVAIVVDNGWTSASGWGARQSAVGRVITTAEQQSRSVILIETARAEAGASATPQLLAPAEARRQAAALVPQPFAPDRAGALSRLRTALGDAASTATIAWFSDGIDHGAVAAFSDGIAAIGAADLAVYAPPESDLAVGVSAGLGGDGKLTARVVTVGGARREGILHALSDRGERLSEARLSIGEAATSTEVTFDLPLELRNQVARVVLSGARSAGAVALLDARSKWNRVGLVSGANQEQAQPLLGPLYYINRALKPFADVLASGDAGATDEIRAHLNRNATVLMLADIGLLPTETQAPLVEWIERGGVLLRFAGPRLEQGGDALLPVPLRAGGRTLGGALSWSKEQALAAFPDDSPFAGLAVPEDVRIRRYVLTDPVALEPNVAVWASLADGTPLVTARRMQRGYLVLFHVTANSKWSNLPLSGLFVDMLRRVATLANVSAETATGASSSTAAPASDVAEGSDQTVLTPRRTLDGFGVLGNPPATAQALAAADVTKVTASATNPPGYYGTGITTRAVNLVSETTTLTPISDLPSGAQRVSYGAETQTDLKPWLLGAAFAMLLIDILAVLILQGVLAGLFAGRGQRASTASMIAVFAVSASVAVVAIASPADAAEARLATEVATPKDGAATASVRLAQRTQQGSSSPSSDQAAPSNDKKPAFDPALAHAATSKVTFGYVRTGDAGLDATSKAGLEGLVKVLTARTAVEPGPPFGVDIDTDDISFFPVLYWPVTDAAASLSEPVTAKLDAYMKRGGMIIFDTRDYGQGLPLGVARGGLTGRRTGTDDGRTPIQRLLQTLDIPRLEPVPEDHVLTKSFYRINSFPGRFSGGQLWVEATEANPTGSREARRADGVTSILITPNDLASAWALDEANQPLFPVVPGGERQREWAFRTGVNIVMYALTGNYKADQVHVKTLLERFGQ